MYNPLNMDIDCSEVLANVQGYKLYHIATRDDPRPDFLASKSTILVYFPTAHMYGVHDVLGSDKPLFEAWGSVKDKYGVSYHTVSMCPVKQCQSCDLCRCVTVKPQTGSVAMCYDTINAMFAKNVANLPVDIFYTVTLVVSQTIMALQLRDVENSIIMTENLKKYKTRARRIHNDMGLLHSTMYIFNYLSIPDDGLMNIIVVFAVNQELATTCAMKHKPKEDGELMLNDTLTFPGINREMVWKSLGEEFRGITTLQYHANGVAFWHCGCVSLGRAVEFGIAYHHLRKKYPV